MDTKSKFINPFVVGSASVHDSQATDDLLDEKDEGQELYTDSAFTGDHQEETIAKHKMINKVHEKGYRNNPLTDEQKKSNTEKSRTRLELNTFLDLWNKV